MGGSTARTTQRFLFLSIPSPFGGPIGGGCRPYRPDFGFFLQSVLWFARAPKLDQT